MSLLMDALRKAEADKQAASSRDAGLEITAVNVTSLSTSTDELRLEPLIESTLDRVPLGRSDEFVSSDLAHSTTRPNIGGRLRVNPGDVTIADELPFDRPPRQLALDDRAFPEDGSLTRPEIVTPHTVITAAATSSVNPALIASFVMVLLMILGVGGYAFYYYRHLPVAPTLPSPRVLDVIEAPAKHATPAPIVSEPVVVLPPPSEPLATPAPVIDIPSEMQAVAAEPEPSTPAPRARARTPRATEPLTSETEITTGEVRIARASRRTRNTSAALNRAYAAFIAGDFVVAQQGYQKVLDSDATQPDALLGLAGIAVTKGDLKTAHHYYTQVLAEEPSNSAAAAGLALIEGNRAGAATEAKLKMLLDRGTDTPYLHFALGNLYAGKRQWPDAQQAYFEAFRANPRNPDYAFNLAVSLEHLGQAAAALDYYRKAQALHSTGSARFTADVVAQRIAALSAVGP